MRDLVKITFQLNGNDWHGFELENVWARPLVKGDDPTVYEILNTPFYSSQASYLDIVSILNENEILKIEKIVKSGGHSTYRILTYVNQLEFSLWWKKLRVLGCTYESGRFGEQLLYAVDVPPETNIFQVYSILDEGENSNIWIFSEGHVGHNVSN